MNKNTMVIFVSVIAIAVAAYYTGKKRALDKVGAEANLRI